jgi:hypothetical protein
VVYGNPIFESNLGIQMALVVALDKTIYSNLVLDKSIKAYFLLDQVMTPPTKRK